MPFLSTETNDKDIIMVRLTEFPETLKNNNIYKILKQQYTNSDPIIPILREIYEREMILSNIIDMYYIVDKLNQITPNNISSTIHYEFVLQLQILYLSVSKDIQNYKNHETISEYIYDISLLLTTQRENLLKNHKIKETNLFSHR